MMASFSLTTDLHHHDHGGGGAATSSSLTTPSPPPPTPSNHSFPSNPDDLSRFLHQLLISPPPLLLSRPPRSHPPPQPPLISLLDANLDLLLSAASSLGFFHLSDHGIPSHLHDSALRESQTLISSSPRDVSALGFGHLDDDEEEEPDGRDPIIVLDADDDSAGDLRLLEYARRLKKVGLELLGLLFGENPFGEGKRKAKCLMWVSSRATAPPSYSGGGIGEEGKVRIGKGYPYVIGLQYEGKGREPSWVMGDSGEWIAVPPQDDSLLVTLGDIAQVWSNGNFKKVRGRAQPSPLPSGDCNTSGCISLSMLITLPLDSVISSLVPSMVEDSKHQSTDRADNGGAKFRPFSLEEYAWRVFHERLLPLKDPLARYQI
ncbi:uncharacterized protein [Typha angustifolia]|uniref:uncharacterized protein n=1 Tax=Typha angustifolia TaxID=59011 RepID=UPI003C2E1D99